MASLLAKHAAFEFGKRTRNTCSLIHDRYVPQNESRRGYARITDVPSVAILRINGSTYNGDLRCMYALRIVSANKSMSQTSLSRVVCDRDGSRNEDAHIASQAAAGPE
jgi:hypothetical protein